MLKKVDASRGLCAKIRVLHFGKVFVLAARNGTSLRALARKAAFEGADVTEELFLFKPTMETRPASTVDDLPENWREIMHKAALNGEGPTSWIVYLKIDKKALDTLIRDSDVFFKHYCNCLLIQKLWYENIGREIMLTGEGDARVWIMKMANFYNYKTANSKNEIQGDLNVEKTEKVKLENLTLKEIQNEIQKRLGVKDGEIES